MAIYHLAAKIIGRRKGQSAVHKAAYNARMRLYDARGGKKTKNYKNEGPLLFERIFAPAQAPEWVMDREKLWNKVEELEQRKDARLAREIDIALPYELTAEQREQLLEQFVLKAFVAQGMIADVVIHAATKRGDPRNCHAHILLPTREITAEGFAEKKNRDWNKVEMLQQWRVLWGDTCNFHLERAGHSVRINHGSHKELGIGRVPTKHVGPQIMRMESKGIRTRRGDYLRANQSNPGNLKSK